MTRKIAHHNTIIDTETGKGTQATITVYDVETTDLSTIYSDPQGTSKDNPFNTDSYGRFSFYVDSGVYDIRVSGTGMATYKIEDVSILDFSIPPSGGHEMLNIYYDPTTGKYKVEHNDAPEE